MTSRSLNAALAADNSGIDGSSLDELALSRLGTHPSSLRKTPLAPQSTNFRLPKFGTGSPSKLQSPAKHVYIETPGVPGSIRVTVQAEQVLDWNDEGTPSKRSTNKPRVVKVPLKDADEPNLAKRRPGRPRKSDAGLSAGQLDARPSAIKKRKGTPMKRQLKRLSENSESLVDTATSPPAKKKVGRPRKIVPQDDPDGQSQSLKRMVGRPRKVAPQAELDVAHTDEESAGEQPAHSSGSRVRIYQSHDPSPEADESPKRASSTSLDRPRTSSIDNFEPLHSEAEPFQLSARPAEDFSPTPEIPSVGQPPRHYDHRRRLQETQPVGSAAGTRRVRTSKPISSEALPSVRRSSLELPASSTFSPRRFASAEMQSRPKVDRHSQLDFTKLTPLHEKHTIAPMQSIYRHMPARSTPRPESDEVVVPRREAPSSSPMNPNNADLRNPFYRPTSSPKVLNERIDSASSEAQPEEQNEDEKMWRSMIPDQADVNSSDGEATPASDSDEFDYGEPEEMTGRPIGEATLMQSEEFSMVSLDSLESVRDIHSSFLGGNQLNAEDRPTNTPREQEPASGSITQQPTSVKHSSKLKQAWLPESSPAAHLSPNVSTQRGRQSSRPLSSPNFQRQSSRNNQSSLQYDLRPNEGRRPGARLSLDGLDSSPVGAAPTSSFLIPGQQHTSVNTSSPKEADDEVNHSRVQLPLATHSANGRLPTPSSVDKESQITDNSPFDTYHRGSEQQFQPSSPLEINPSLTKSDGVASMQSQTPPSTTRGSSPVIDNAQNLPSSTLSASAAQQLPSSPPNRIANSGGLEQTRQWRLKQEALERTWEAAKAQFSPPSLRQNRPIVIESDHGSSDDSNDEEEENDQNESKEKAIEEEIEDVWQEEASRASNIDESTLSNRSRHVDSGIKRKLFSNSEKPQSPRPNKVIRTTKPFSASPKDDRHVNSQDRSVNSEHERQKKSASTIADLFKTVTGTRADSGDSNHSNSESFVEHNLPALVGFGSQGKTKAEHTISTSIDRRNSPRSPRPMRSSQLRRQLPPDTDESLGKQTDSFISVASDVRQLRHEATLSQRMVSGEKLLAPQASAKQSYPTQTTTTQKVPTNMRSVDDSTESEHERYNNTSLLSLNPKRSQSVRPLFSNDLFAEISEAEMQAQSKKPAAVEVALRVAAKQSEVEQKGKSPRVEKQTNRNISATAPGMLGRVWANLPSIPFISNPVDQSENGPPRPKHPLLVNLMLLPRTQPFTKTHYQVMEQLWKKHKVAPKLFSTSHPTNAGLMTQSLSRFANATLSDWGYTVQFDSSLMILVSLFMRLLVLNDADEFEATEGREIELGDPGRLWFEAREREKSMGKNAEVELTEAFCVMRLFSIIACESVREDERRGAEIDRSIPFKWKTRGQRGWKFTLLDEE